MLKGKRRIGSPKKSVTGSCRNEGNRTKCNYKKEGDANGTAVETQSRVIRHRAGGHWCYGKERLEPPRKTARDCKRYLRKRRRERSDEMKDPLSLEHCHRNSFPTGVSRCRGHGQPSSHAVMGHKQQGAHDAGSTDLMLNSLMGVGELGSSDTQVLDVVEMRFPRRGRFHIGPKRSDVRDRDSGAIPKRQSQKQFSADACTILRVLGRARPLDPQAS